MTGIRKRLLSLNRRLCGQGDLQPNSKNYVPYELRPDHLKTLFRMVKNSVGFNIVRSREFMDWVKTQPCVFCGDPLTDPHHIFGSSVKLKSSDLFTIPLCRDCHNQIDTDVRRYELLHYWIIIIYPILEEAWQKSKSSI